MGIGTNLDLWNNNNCCSNYSWNNKFVGDVMRSNKQFSDSDKCTHKIKRIFSHGKKSKPKWVCKYCGQLLARGIHKKELDRQRGRNKYVGEPSSNKKRRGRK